MPWLCDWYDYTYTQCEPVAREEFEKLKGALLRRERIDSFSFRRAGSDWEKGYELPQKGYIPERLNAPIILEAKGIFFAAPGSHKIALISDDGSRLRLMPGVTILDNWGMHVIQKVERELWLPPIVLLQLTFFDNCVTGVIEVQGDLK